MKMCLCVTAGEPKAFHLYITGAKENADEQFEFKYRFFQKIADFNCVACGIAEIDIRMYSQEKISLKVLENSGNK